MPRVELMNASDMLLGALNGLLLLLAAMTGIRLLMIARRTRQAPELLLGSGFSSGILIGLPLVGASGIDRLPSGEVNLMLVGAAHVALATAFYLLGAFTRMVFRPGRGWATMLMVSFPIVILGATAFMARALAAAEPHIDSFEVAHPFTMFMRLPMIVSLGWVGIEATSEWYRARKRLLLGLADAVVVQRFLSFGMFGLILAFGLVVSLVLSLFGYGVMNSLAGLLSVVAASAVSGVFLALSFFPPQAYVDYIVRRAEARRV